MSLFIGNIPRSAAAPDLHNLFTRYGSCSVDHKGSFAFIDFDHLKSAETAITELQGRLIQGNSLNIEWSKKTKKKSKLPEPSNTSRNLTKNEIECYLCREQGHISKDCRLRKENSKGHILPYEESTILNQLRKNSPEHCRYRIKSPSRYAQAAQQSFNIVKLE